MKLVDLKKTKDGKYLKNYELTYLNKAGKEKVYEIVSRNELESPDDLGKHTDGVSIIAYNGDRMLLLKEFRMGVNRPIFNLCAGLIEKDETVEECIRRELYEETGLKLEKINAILRPCYNAVAISDIKTVVAYVEVSGEIEDHSSANEAIEAKLYTRDEVRLLLEKEDFASRSQIAAYNFAFGS